MLSALQKRKLTVLFHHHDRDADGFLTKADYEGFAKRTCRLWKFRAGSPEYKTLYGQNVAVWDYVQSVADKDKDGKVSLDDFLNSYDVTIHDKKLMGQMVVAYSMTTIQLGDLDHDGKLSAAEFVAMIGCYGVPKKQAQEAFRHLDVKGSGYLTSKQVIDRYTEFLGDDPDAPGNWMVGPY